MKLADYLPILDDEEKDYGSRTTTS